MHNRSTPRFSHRITIAIATLFTALSIFFASATDVGAALRSSIAPASSPSSGPVVSDAMWRGAQPLSYEHMYRRQAPERLDWIRESGRR